MRASTLSLVILNCICTKKQRYTYYTYFSLDYTIYKNVYIYIFLIFLEYYLKLNNIYNRYIFVDQTIKKKNDIMTKSIHISVYINFVT